MILDNSPCPCGHEVVDGDCVVWDQHGVEHRVPNSPPDDDACTCCGTPVRVLERREWWAR